MPLLIKGLDLNTIEFSVPEWRAARIESEEFTATKIVETIPIWANQEVLRSYLKMYNEDSTKALAWFKENIAPHIPEDITTSPIAITPHPSIPVDYYDRTSGRVKDINGYQQDKSKCFVTNTGEFILKSDPRVASKTIHNAAFCKEFFHFSFNRPHNLSHYFYEVGGVAYKIDWDKYFIKMNSNSSFPRVAIPSHISISSYKEEIAGLSTLSLENLVFKDAFGETTTVVVTTSPAPNEHLVPNTRFIIPTETNLVWMLYTGYTYGLQARELQNIENHVRWDTYELFYFQGRFTQPLTKAKKTENDKGSLLAYSTDVLKYKPGFQQAKMEVDKDVVFMGYEWETEVREGVNRSDVIKSIAQSSFGDCCVIKSDGSLNYERGMELVTVPATLKMHQTWLDTIFPAEIVSSLSTSGRCGMHVHVGKRHFTKLSLGKLIAFINLPENREFITGISGRELGSYCSPWNLKEKAPVACLDKQGDKILSGETSIGPRGAINLGKKSTVEYRIFASPNNFTRLKVNLQFVDASVRFVRETSIQNIKARDFIQWLGSRINTYPDLVQHIYKMKKGVFANLLPTSTLVQLLKIQNKTSSSSSTSTTQG